MKEGVPLCHGPGDPKASQAVRTGEAALWEKKAPGVARGFSNRACALNSPSRLFPPSGLGSRQSSSGRSDSVPAGIPLPSLPPVPLSPSLPPSPPKRESPPPAKDPSCNAPPPLFRCLYPKRQRHADQSIPAAPSLPPSRPPGNPDEA